MNIDALLQEHGLWFVTLGTFIEGDAVALGAGVLEHRGVFRFWPVVAAAALGGFCADMMVYTIGRLGNRTRFVRRILSDRRTQGIQRRVFARPYVLAFASRFIPGSRTVIPVSIGAANAISAPAYAGLMALACTCWALVLIGVGHEIGNLMNAVFGYMPMGWVIAGGATLILSLLITRSLWRKRRTARADRDVGSSERYPHPADR
ncbi:Inner membrane protein YohD [Rhodobacteraceae bacterium THAF1]|uniref:DedA family protein n=1 Tax=Palleronia sp. THAF1 TaxID=2587842 RepID=UPI000F4188D8|nr:DedA family protein [Palleronia sp. THAF1]QFU07997.1 Inner membrane protein YohD [Palleronia sp. THAF1]VDC27848.1 Inner membrane protein YohD [Rhodobacteraceae bacterium THAF1]